MTVKKHAASPPHAAILDSVAAEELIAVRGVIARIVRESAQLLQEDHPWKTRLRMDYIIWDFERKWHRNQDPA